MGKKENELALAEAIAKAGSDANPEFALQTSDLSAALEAILMVAPNPVPVPALVAATGMKAKQVEETLQGLQKDYDGEDGGVRRGFELRVVDGGWRIYSRPAFAPWVAAFVAGAETSALSQAALETLAIVAYRQPVTRGQIARIRGVNVDTTLRTLQLRDLIEEVGQTPTGGHLFGTTTAFLERMGLDDISQLPPLAPFMPGPETDLDFLDREGQKNEE